MTAMKEGFAVSTRRGAIGRMLGVALGAAGLGALAEAKASPGAPATALAARHDLRLLVEHLQQKPVLDGDVTRHLPYGALLDGDRAAVGSFHTAALGATSGTISMQSFDLPDGTILGLGSGGLANDTYAIVGGTGTYAGVTGSYVARPAAHLPGRPIEFTFTFREDAHGRS
jgi:hypothetical protein